MGFLRCMLTLWVGAMCAYYGWIVKQDDTHWAKWLAVEVQHAFFTFARIPHTFPFMEGRVPYITEAWIDYLLPYKWKALGVVFGTLGACGALVMITPRKGFLRYLRWLAVFVFLIFGVFTSYIASCRLILSAQDVGLKSLDNEYLRNNMAHSYDLFIGHAVNWWAITGIVMLLK